MTALRERDGLPAAADPELAGAPAGRRDARRPGVDALDYAGALADGGGRSADGTYRVEWLPAGSYRVVVATTAPRRKASASVSTAPGATALLDLTLPG